MSYKITHLILEIARGELGIKPFHSDWMYNRIKEGNPSLDIKRKTIKDLCSRLAKQGFLKRIKDIFIVNPTSDLAGLIQVLTTTLETHGNIPIYSTKSTKILFSMIVRDHKFIKM